MSAPCRWMAMAAVALLSTVPTASSAADRDTHDRINDAIVETVIRPGYERFAEATQALQPAVERLCQSPREDTLVAARTAFHDAVDAWQAVQFLRIGAMARQLRHERIQFWPDKRGRIGKHLNRLLVTAEAAALDLDAFAKSSVAVQGLPALGRLLFAGDETLARLTDVSAAVNRCALAAAIADNLSTIAGRAVDEWRSGEDQLDRPTETLGLMFTDVATGLRAIADLKLGDPTGIESGRIRERRVENRRAGRSLRNIALNIDGLKRAFAAITDAGGVAGTPEETFIRQQFDAVAGDARALGPSLTAVLRSEGRRDRILALHGSVRDLADLVIGYGVENLGLSLGFNSLDGD